MKQVNLSSLRTCVVIAEERPRITLIQTFNALFSSLGLSPKAVSTSFGSRVNIAICMQVIHVFFLTSKNDINSFLMNFLFQDTYCTSCWDIGNLWFFQKFRHSKVDLNIGCLRVDLEMVGFHSLTFLSVKRRNFRIDQFVRNVDNV